MRLELLLVPDCPNEAPARAAIARAATLAGIEAPEIVTSVVHTGGEAARLGFVGSPTILVDGRDPFADPNAATALTCRMYATRAGLAGVPDVEALAAALVRANGEQ